MTLDMAIAWVVLLRVHWLRRGQMISWSGMQKRNLEVVGTGSDQD